MKYLWIPLFLLVAVPAGAQTAENVAVVINDNSAVSQKIGEYYARKRGIPAAQVVHIKAPEDELIDRPTYAATVEAPIGAALSRAGLQDKILYLVLTKGVPLRIRANAQTSTAASSVDSELTLLYRRLTGQSVAALGRADNPYFAGARADGPLRHFSHKEFDIYLVTRLDGFSVEDVIGLVDRGSAPVREGRIVLDQQDKLVNRTADEWLDEAARRLEVAGEGERVVLEKTVNPARDVASVLGYASWGSNDPRNRVRKFGMTFVPGALATLFVSADARTFREPPASWVPGQDADRAKWFSDSPQSLAGDLIREGVTGLAANVSEPSTQSVVRPEILFPAYLSGANLAEAFYAAIPHLSWQTVVIGDPLCAPFRQTPIAKSEIDAGIDSDTLLPALFSKRRVAVMTKMWPKASERSLKLAIRGDVLLMRGEAGAAKAAYEEATAQSPTIVPAQLALAVLLDSTNQGDLAMERYRLVLASQPDNVTALNNLAYRLATEKKQPTEALPLARRAAKLDQSPTVLDTLAWVQHLLKDPEAVRTMAAALKGDPNNADIRLHAAIIYAGSGAKAVAEDQLKAALKLRPSLESSREVKELRERLAQPSSAK